MLESGSKSHGLLGRIGLRGLATSLFGLKNADATVAKPELVEPKSAQRTNSVSAAAAEQMDMFTRAAKRTRTGIMGFRRFIDKMAKEDKAATPITLVDEKAVQSQCAQAAEKAGFRLSSRFIPEVAVGAGSKVEAGPGSKILAQPGSYVQAFGGAMVTAQKGAHVVAEANSIVFASAGSYVTAKRDARVIAQGGAYLRLEDGAIVEPSVN